VLEFEYLIVIAPFECKENKNDEITYGPTFTNAASLYSKPTDGTCVNKSETVYEASESVNKFGKTIEIFAPKRYF